MNRSPRALERGDAEPFEFLSMVPVLLFVVTLIAMAGIVRAAQIPIWAAARECARMAAATLSPDIGMRQGEEAARNSLAGNNLNAGAALVTLSGNWSRGGSVTCSVDYVVPFGGLPLAGWLGRDHVDLHSEFTLTVEPHKSRW